MGGGTPAKVKSLKKGGKNPNAFDALQELRNSCGRWEHNFIKEKGREKDKGDGDKKSSTNGAPGFKAKG